MNQSDPISTELRAQQDGLNTLTLKEFVENVDSFRQWAAQPVEPARLELEEAFFEARAEQIRNAGNFDDGAVTALVTQERERWRNLLIDNEPGYAWSSSSHVDALVRQVKDLIPQVGEQYAGDVKMSVQLTSGGDDS